MASRRLVVVFILLCVGVMNVLAVSTFEQEEYGIAATVPGQDSNEVLRMMVFDRLNVERWRNNLNVFGYLRDDSAQEHAAAVLSSGDRSIDQALEPGLGENVAYYRIQGQVFPVLVDGIVSDMVSQKEGGRCRENLLNTGFLYVSVGVAYDDTAICVVVGFFRFPMVD